MQGPNGRWERRKGPPPPLDEPARQKMATFSEVSEVYPDIRFPAEVKLDSPGTLQDPPQQPDASKSESGGTAASAESARGRDYQLISGLPMSARQLETFDNMKGKYFSAADAAEVILQSDEARSLSDKPEDLLGKDIVIRYASRHLLKDN